MLLLANAPCSSVMFWAIIFLAMGKIVAPIATVLSLCLEICDFECDEKGAKDQACCDCNEGMDELFIIEEEAWRRDIGSEVLKN